MVGWLPDRLGLGVSQLERSFTRHVGVGPLRGNDQVWCEDHHCRGLSPIESGQSAPYGRSMQAVMEKREVETALAVGLQGVRYRRRLAELVELLVVEDGGIPSRPLRTDPRRPRSD